MRDLVQKEAAQGGLTRAYFSGNHNDALSLCHSEKQIREGFFVLTAGKEKSRVRSHIKRPFL
jgi:hypothetical protein